jgi:hypothetical protein
MNRIVLSSDQSQLLTKRKYIYRKSFSLSLPVTTTSELAIVDETELDCIQKHVCDVLSADLKLGLPVIEL